LPAIGMDDVDTFKCDASLVHYSVKPARSWKMSAA
jgi:hypothetical protein